MTLECKRAKSEVPKSVWETYSAFANTIGGVILLGIEENRKESDKKKRFQIIGVDDAQKIVNDFWNTINSDKVNENILASSNVETVEINGVQIVCIHVPQADWRIKPIYLNGNVYKGTYRRNHEGDYHCTERQVRAMIRDSFEDGNDGMLLEHYDMNTSTLIRFTVTVPCSNLEMMVTCGMKPMTKRFSKILAVISLIGQPARRGSRWLV